MKISTRGEYSCLALIELARSFHKKAPLQIQDIARKQKIPSKYLVQILLQLKEAGFVTSRRGKTGGYFLARPPGQIRLGEVIRRMEGPFLPLPCLVSEGCVREDGCGLKKTWQDVEKAISKVVDKLTFENMAEECRAKGETYNI
ncbi:MAG: Rrf2 family transcriptional regulator [Candidatus Omnitrophica bacterium]|nr:Rrf2 family transcriptional regulator [Candidatus Omnitrophota bacterium]